MQRRPTLQQIAKQKMIKLGLSKASISGKRRLTLAQIAKRKLLRQK